MCEMIINAGIDRIVVAEGYPDEMALEFLKAAGKEVELVEDGGE